MYNLFLYAHYFIWGMTIMYYIVIIVYYSLMFSYLVIPVLTCNEIDNPKMMEIQTFRVI
jgi:hypothetical protein